MTHRMQAGSGALRRAKTEGEQVTNRREFEWLARYPLAPTVSLRTGGRRTPESGPREGTAGERPPPGWTRTPAGAEGEQPVTSGVVTPL